MPDRDEDSETLRNNLLKAYRLSRDAARKRRDPTVDLARDWHETVMRGLTVTLDGLPQPERNFVGAFRGEPGLEDIGVRIGAHEGTSRAYIATDLDAFEARLGNAVEALDKIIVKGALPRNADEINAVIELCAWVHFEWVRIRPLGNGNGRTARIRAGFIAMRYGVPPFVRLRPRPDGGYGSACGKAMDGDWTATVAVFRKMYLETVRTG